MAKSAPKTGGTIISGIDFLFLKAKKITIIIIIKAIESVRIVSFLTCLALCTAIIWPPKQVISTLFEEILEAIFSNEETISSFSPVFPMS